ncbi:Endoplasmic Reticulum Aminopeptidase 1 [Manis pentadactyla]|nr:Endoplasmic Reticulum Aminopeptidase 1 [Manis pentadactyla]
MGSRVCPGPAEADSVPRRKEGIRATDAVGAIRGGLESPMPEADLWGGPAFLAGRQEAWSWT